MSRAAMVVPFTKASACGNDFLIIEGSAVRADHGEFTRRICDRHNGVGAGRKTCTLTGKSGVTYEFETAMGIPEVGGSIAIATQFGEIDGIPVSVGNPHFVIFVDHVWSDWQKRAVEIQRVVGFKQGINVELVVVRNTSNIDVVFYERGVGETQSSGTGSSAAAVASIATGRAKSPVRVHAAGGTQEVRFENEVFLRGPATLICEGEFFV
jgi:diaminopimelate epimerase